MRIGEGQDTPPLPELRRLNGNVCRRVFPELPIRTHCASTAVETRLTLYHQSMTVGLFRANQKEDSDGHPTAKHDNERCPPIEPESTVSTSASAQQGNLTTAGERKT